MDCVKTMGPYHHSSVVAEFVERCADGSELLLCGSGDLWVVLILVEVAALQSKL